MSDNSDFLILKRPKFLAKFLQRDNIIFLISNIFFFWIYITEVDYPKMVYHEWIGGVFKSIAQSQKNIQNYFSLAEQNELLQKENEYLHSLIQDNYVIDYRDSSSGNRHKVILSKSINAHPNYKVLPRYVWIRGHIIQKINRHGKMMILINLGGNDGLLKGMPVIGTNGVAGKILKVYPKYALATSLYHQQTKIGARVKMNGSTGILNWNEDNPFFLTLKEIPQTDSVKMGDSVFTSHLSYSFPANIPIGKIEKEISSDGYYKDYSISPFESIQKLEHVYVIKNMHDESTFLLDEF